MLKRIFWKDEDPLWRWASGQYVRRWWKNPTVGLVLSGVVILSLPFIIAGLVDGWDDLFEITYVVMLYTAVILHFLAFLIIPIRAIHSFSQMGGQALMRDLMLTDSRARIPKLLFWGSCRRYALPFFLLTASAALMGAVGVALDEDISRFGLGGVLILSLFFMYIIKPLLDHWMNLSIAWGLLFRTGKSGFSQFIALILIVLVFPATSYLILFVGGFMAPFALFAWLIVAGAAAVMFYLLRHGIVRWLKRYVGAIIILASLVFFSMLTMKQYMLFVLPLACLFGWVVFRLREALDDDMALGWSVAGIAAFFVMAPVIHWVRENGVGLGLGILPFSIIMYGIKVAVAVGFHRHFRAKWDEDLLNNFAEV